MKMPAVMQHGPTLDQLRSAGVIAAVTITRSAFPNRLDHENVLERFKHLAKNTTSNPGDSLEDQVEKLLNPLLKHMATETDGGRVMKAFATGKTRTYFRTGALEFLEAERIKGFDPAAVIIQKVARGFLVRKRQHNAYIINRDAATVIQARARVLLAKTKVDRAKEEKKLSEKHNSAATIINAIARGAVRRMRFKDELKQYREVLFLKNELALLQLKVEESERLKKEAVKAAEERVREAMDIFKDNQTQADSNSAEAEETARLLAEKNKVIEKNRSDNKRIRANIKMLESRYKRLREESKKLKDENDALTEKFLKMNEEAKALNAENAKAVENQGIWKKQVTAMSEEMKRKHQAFVEASNSRVQYQNTMAEIIKMLRTQCKDEQLIEDVIFIALDSDTEAKALRAAFEALQEHRAEKKEKGASPVPATIGKGDDADCTEDSTSSSDEDDVSSCLSTPSMAEGGDDDDDSLVSFDEDELDREEAEMEAEVQTLAAEVGM
jgi:myosin heavy subunit